MKCEIEFLPVGDQSKAGDAIVIRYGEPNDYKLMLIDGGHAVTGDLIVAHLKKFFGPAPILEHVVLTHSDADHASGLRTVLKEVQVNNLWLHLPWRLAEESRHLFKDKKWTEVGLRDYIKKEYDIVSEIFDIALEKKCKVYYPFSGNEIGPFKILSPSRRAYSYLLPQFDRTPAPDQEAIASLGIWIGKENALMKLIEAAKAKAQKWMRETWEDEKLKDGGVTNPSNESSVVLYGSFETGNVLLTGDAGIMGLTWAASKADELSLPLQQFAFVQIPHHGSRRNVGPTILTRILGEKQIKGSPERFYAFVSAPKDDDSHPRRIVLNAFKRRGAKTVATQGYSKIYWGGFAKRNGYSDAELLPFYDSVEEY